MVLKLLSVTALLLATSSIVIFNGNQTHKTVDVPTMSTPAPRNVYVGAWVTNFWDNDTKKISTGELTKFEETIGHKMALANIYSEWSYLANPDLLDNLNIISSNGWTPIISANPSFFKYCSQGADKSIYKAIAGGKCDEFLRAAAVNLRTFGKPVMFRFAWEMNLPNMYWSIKKTNSEPQDFIDAWRHMHEILKEENANNVIWVLSFNTSSDSTVPYKDLFPGNDYVDWVAIDGYNWGTAQDWSKWTSFNGVFRRSYNELTQLTDKPLMLSEVNSAPDGGDKAQWLDDMLSVQIPDIYTKVQAIVFFNENKTEGESVDWRMEKSPEFVNAVKKGLENKLYRKDYP